MHWQFCNKAQARSNKSGSRQAFTLVELLVVIAINLGIGFIPGANISWQAHLFGAIGGAVAALILRPSRPAARATLTA